MESRGCPSAKTAGCTDWAAGVLFEEEGSISPSAGYPLPRGPGSPSLLDCGFCETWTFSLYTPLAPPTPTPLFIWSHVCKFSFFCFVSFFFFSHPAACGNSRPGIRSKPQFWPMTQQQQGWIINPLCRSRGRTRIPAHQRCCQFCCATAGTPVFLFVSRVSGSKSPATLRSLDMDSSDEQECFCPKSRHDGSLWPREKGYSSLFCTIQVRIHH